MGNRHKTQDNDKSNSFDNKDTKNAKQFQELSRARTQQPYHIDSSHLLEINQLQQVYIKHFNCSSSECAHLKRLVTVLTKYHSFITKYEQTDDEKEEQNISNTEIKNDNINEIYNDDYNAVSTIDDFHHLLNIHQHQFEELYDIFINQCNNGKICTLSNCLMLRRNHRLRTNDIQLKRIYFSCDNINDVVNQQILDAIHCHYFHSVDVGYVLSKNDKIKIQQDIQNKNDINHESKQQEENLDNYCYDRITRHIYDVVDNLRFEGCNSIKFVTSLNDTELKYSYGVKYFYWEYYKSNNNESVDPATHSTVYDLYPKPANEGYLLSEFYVNAKYLDLKSELINNPICSINVAQWNNLIQKANQYLQTQGIKETKCKSGSSEKYYNIIKNTPITCTHLVAMMTYCNYTELQREFSKTYRRIPQNESNDSLIKRHSNYANWGRLLRECVDCFGSDKTLIIRKMCLYHGTSGIPQFPSINAWIKGPCSTTTDYSVAVSFAGKKGTILELCLNKYLMNNGLFECKYISDFPNEQEIFFIGGQCGFTFLSIIQVSHAQNYKLYVRALAKMQQHLGGWTMHNEQIDRNIDTSAVEIMCFRMILDELHRHFPDNKDYVEFKSMPPYIRKLLHYHFSNITQIVFRGNVDENNYYAKLFYYSLYYDYGWIKLDLLTTLFPNVQYIAFYKEPLNVKIMNNKSVYISVVQLLKTKSNLKLKKILLFLGPKYKAEIEKIITKFQSQFEKLNWKLYYHDHSVDCGIIIKSLNDKSEQMNQIEPLSPTYV